MFYQEFLPHPALRPYIHLYGVLEEPIVSVAPITTWIPPVPGVGVVFYYRRRHAIVLRSNHAEQTIPYGYILPYFRSSYTIRYRGDFALLAAIFKPGQARKFLKLPYSALVGRPTSFSELNLKECEYLQDQMQEMSNKARIDRLNRFFLKKLECLPTKSDLLDHALRECTQNPSLYLENLAEKLAISSRHLRRLFRENMGIGPKTFQKIVRFNRALAMITSQQFRTLSEIAYRAGYYDHSHFDAEFREFTGKIPSEFLLQHNRLIDAMHWRNEVENQKIIREKDNMIGAEAAF